MKLVKIGAVIALVAAILFSSQPGQAHEADCPYCKIKLVQNTKDSDSEVVVRFGNKRIEYRCIYCVIADQDRMKSDLIVYAPSEIVGKPVLLRRIAGEWTGPEGAVYLNLLKGHEQCAVTARAFTTKDAFEKYVSLHKLDGAKPLTLKEFVEAASKKG